MFIHRSLLLITATWLSTSVLTRARSDAKTALFRSKQANLRGKPGRAVPFRPTRLISYAPHRRCRTRRKEISLVTIYRAARGPTLAASGHKIHAASPAQADAIRWAASGS